MNGTRRTGFESFTLNALRIVAGLMWAQHGVQKLFGWLDGNQVDTVFSLMGVAGTVETFGGLLLAVGLFTRPVAFLGAVQMAVAYGLAHVGGMAETAREAIFPILNGGELALLYCFVWLLILAFGPGSFSVDARMRSPVTEA